jgi:superfamily I DNA/RNA helicase
MHFEQIPVEEVKKIAPQRDGGHFHGVRFYNDPDALCRIVGGFVGEGLERGDIAILIATPDHVMQIEACLRQRGIDIGEVTRGGQLLTFDARETLQRFMVDGMPDPGTFRRALTQILKDARRGGEHRAIRAYGEMVDLLWKDGLEAAAIRLETLWNQLGRTTEFELLCGYSMGNFYKGAAIDEIKAQHSHLVDERGEAAPISAAPQ